MKGLGDPILTLKMASSPGQTHLPHLLVVVVSEVQIICGVELILAVEAAWKDPKQKNFITVFHLLNVLLK